MCWEPYNQLSLSPYCMAGVRVWSSRSPMINFNIVELHCPDRVLQKFGMRQHVPASCNTEVAVHQTDRRGKTGVDWAQLHRNYIQAWESRHENAVGVERASPYLHYCDPYMVWYRSITRIRVGPLPIPVPTSGYRPGAYIRGALADQLARVSALSQDAMQLGQSSEYSQTLQQVHDESYGRLEHLGMSHLIPPPGTTSQHCTDPQRSSPTRQVPNQFAEASSSHGQQNHTFSDYGDRRGAFVARDIYDAYQYSSDAYQHSAQPTYYERVHSPAPQLDEEYVQPTYEYAQRNYYEYVHSPAPRPDQEPIQGEDDAHNEGLSTLGYIKAPDVGRGPVVGD